MLPSPEPGPERKLDNDLLFIFIGLVVEAYGCNNDLKHNRDPLTQPALRTSNTWGEVDISIIPGSTRPRP